MEELIIKEREFKENIVKTINDSGLPAFILKPIIKDLYGQLEVIEQQQYAEALKNKEKKSKASK